MDPIPQITPGTDRSVTQDEKQFFRQLGIRIASLRKEQGLTQTQLAEVLDLTQQMIASYEVGRRRVPVSLLPKIAAALAVSVEALIGQDGAPPAMHAHSAKQEAIETIERLPDNVPLDEIVYRLYVLNKVHQGLQDIDAGRVIASDELAREIEQT